MSEEETIEPIETLLPLIEEGNAEQLEAFLDELTPAETARAVSFLTDDQRVDLIEAISADVAADLLEDLPAVQVADMIEDMTPADAAAIVGELASDDRVDVLGDVEDEVAQAILNSMPAASAAATRVLLEYPEDCAGGLMITEFLAYRESVTVGHILDDMRKNRDRYADYNVQYVYIVDRDGGFIGVLRLRDIVLTDGALPATSVMVRDPHFVNAEDSLETLRDYFDEHSFVGAPVVDDKNRLVGVVHRMSVEEAEAEREAESFLKFSGILGGEELRSMPLVERFGRRLPWLSVNILLNIVSASIIALYTDTLEAAIALAVFIPIISDMSGCSGNQAVAVSIRELAMGLASTKDRMRVFKKEFTVGLVNGLVLGVLLFLVAYMWKRNVYLGLVVGGALTLNIMLSVCLGGLIPLVLKQLKQDPALASSPILTTVTDMMGFFLVLSFATALLSRIAI